MKRIVPLAFVLIFNLWLWRIFSFRPLLGIIVLAASVCLWLGVQLNKKIYFWLSVVLFLGLVFGEWQTSSKNSLTFLNESEKLSQQSRARAYPPLKITVLGKSVWIPAANWLELRPEATVFYKLKANLAEVVDPNLYFFANHPRERVGVVEYEKFPYILLPAFIIGLLSIKRQNLKYFALALSPLLLNAVIGNSNPAGPFVLFPFLAVTVSLGLVPIFTDKKLLIPGLIAFGLVFAQVLAYAKY